MVKGNLVAEWITTESDFSALKHHWDTLTTQLNAPLFLQHHWLQAAWAWQKHYATLHLLVIKRKNTLIAVCPFTVQTAFYHHIRVKSLDFLAIPDSQMCDWLVDFAELEKIYPLVIQALDCAPFHWDVINWRLIPENATLLHHDFSPNPFHIKWLDGSIHPTINMHTDWETYYSEKSRRLKKGNNFISNKLNKAGKTEIIRYTPTKENQTLLLDMIIQLSQASWKSETMNTFNMKGPQQFIRTLFEQFCDTEHMVIWCLMLDQTPIAYELNLVENAHYYALRADYHPDFQHLSPGTFLNWKIIQTLFKDGAKYYCFGPGQNTYKLRWQNAEIKLYTLRGYNRTFKGQLVLWLERNIVPVLRPMKHTFSKLIRG